MTSVHLGWIALMAVAVATCLLGGATVLRQLRSWLRWPLALLALVSVGAFTFNWSSGARGFAPLATLFLAVSVDRVQPYGDLVSAVGVPVFALLALLWRALAPR